MYAVAPAIELPPGAHERQERLRVRAEQVFGDDDSLPAWRYQSDCTLGLDGRGEPWTPHRLAAQSEQALQQLLATLDELAKTVTPRWKEKRGRKATRSRGR